ncbi:hypothetical protein BSKO_04369 [Bryopsis sp. KO-2023]|nr:hypothetical protein BSKO_04369 [Bryopsis sp. KO-2023]
MSFVATVLGRRALQGQGSRSALAAVWGWHPLDDTIGHPEQRSVEKPQSSWFSSLAAAESVPISRPASQDNWSPSLVQRRMLSEVAMDEPIMTSMRFNKKIMNWYRKALSRLLKLRDKGSHVMSGATAEKVYIDMMESFSGYSKVYDAVVDVVCVATMLHKSAVLLSLFPNPGELILKHREFIAELMSKAGEMMSNMSDHHAATVLHYYSLSPDVKRLALTGMNHEQLIQKATDTMVNMAPEAKPRSVVLSLLGIAEVKKDDVESAKNLLRALKGHANEADSDMISGIAYAMAKMDLEDEEGILSEYLGVLHDQIEKFRPEAVGNLTWALAKMGHTEGRAFFSRLLMQYRMRMSSALPRDITLTVEALAISGHTEDMNFIEAMAEVASKHSDTFNKKDTQTLIDSFEKLGLKSDSRYWDDFQFA